MWKIICAYVLLITFTFVNGDPKVPCYFIFGDSLSDAGNNNNLITNATANFPPYGVDFPGGVATGRFTNGLTSVDIITKLVGIDGLISPFSTASGRDILKGVNYASGGSGILSESGSNLGDRIWLARQVQNHAITISKLQSMVDGPVNKYLNKCLYTMNIGSNDYINNYFMPKFYSSMKNFTHEQFATILVTEYEQQIKALYDYGARKTAIFGIGLIGCTPAEMRMHNAIFCVNEINNAVGILNKKLLELVKTLNKKLAGAKFTFIDISGVQNASPFAIGNNNDLVTNATANFPPYGVDFPGGLATGRFTNGLTSVDILTSLVGIQGLILPFRTASGLEIRKGVNYASGGAGILSESGFHLGDRIWLARQVKNHATTISKLQNMVDGPVNKYLNKCLYTMNIGSNDYINNYFMPKFYSSMKNFTHEQFATILVTEYEQQIKALYEYGARKTAIFGIGLIGCTPAEMRMNNVTFCVKEINEAVDIMNQKLVKLVDSLNVKFAGAKFTFIDIAGVQKASPLSFGPFVNATCCELRSDYQCKRNVRPCDFRDVYAFMDGFHPTEILHKLIAELSFNSPLRLFVHPVDIKTLISS